MVLDTSALRTPNEGFPPIKERIITLIRITGGEVTQGSTVTEKREMLKALGQDDTLIAVWTGEWRSDAFEVPLELLTRWKRELLG